MEQTAAMRHDEKLGPLDHSGLCLLSLDGGGVRGLSTLYILKGIMKRLNHECGLAGLPHAKPCDVFDLIGGTSTGGLIAIMLGRLEMDVDECISVYSELMKYVFESRLSRFPLNFGGKTKPRFKSAKLESAIKAVINARGFNEKDHFNDEVDRKCRVFVCTIAHETKEIVRLRSYSLPGKLDIPATISEAALATSAATTLFEAVKIGARKFVDGALGANNPVDEVEGEASDIWCPDTGNLKPLVKCFISIGTGNPGKKAIEDKMLDFLSKTLAQIATQTDNTEKRFVANWRQHFDENRYFRFNVDQGLQEVRLTEYQEQGAIEAVTDGYLDHQTQKFRVRDCVQNLKSKHNKTEANFSHMITINTTQTLSNVNIQNLRQMWHIWLTPSHMRKVHDDRIRERLPGTCDWIWPHPSLMKWSSTTRDSPTADRLLCLYGTHGCGKSVLASSIVDSLERNGNRVLFFSFSGTDSSRQSLDSLARSLLWQLLQNPVSYEGLNIMRDLMSHGEPLTSELWIAFSEVTNSMAGLVHWVIDGADECNESGEVLYHQLIDLLSTNKNARATLLGRTHVLRSVAQTNCTIEITPILLQSDINTFISTEIDKTKVLKSSEIRNLAFRTLNDGSDGMFLWVKLMVCDLCKSSSKAEVKVRLQNLPYGLQKTYRHLVLRLVENLDDTDLGFARHVLAFIITASRPLKVDELRYARAVAYYSELEASPDYSLEDCIPEDIVERALRVCGDFIRITDDVVLLVHISVREFLTKPENEWPRDGNLSVMRLRIDLEESHCLFTSACIDYLHSILPLKDSDDFSAFYDVHPFLEYTWENATYHCNRAGRLPTDLMDKIYRNFASEASLSWTRYVSMRYAENEASSLEAGMVGTLPAVAREEGFSHDAHFRMYQGLKDRGIRTGQYKMLHSIAFDAFDDNEPPGSISDHQVHTSGSAGLNDVPKPVSAMMNILRHDSAPTAPKQTELLIRMSYHFRRVNVLTDPFELLCRTILRNAEVIHVYAVVMVGNFYKRLDKPKKALKAYQTVIAKFGTSEVPIKYIIWCIIGSIHSQFDQYQEAEEAHRQATEGREKLLGSEHHNTLFSIHNLADALHKQKKYVQAEETYRQATKGREKTLGPEHEGTLDSMYCLAITLHRLGKYAQAKDTFRRVIEGQEKTLGLEHEHTIRSNNALADVVQEEEGVVGIWRLYT
ncbi:uncharacterized protein F4822DRAFT_225814 [Hypoxylon trugodes]|uniref:uncharacterized protein n=1 Tax=Hypoxylon trugodes TaxID=326681 RepID=UPI0021A1117A|nr:uncharacterized protein F4822DRAFT_225814 [Hypoxylon trugodes]KAI1390156.1 hypothetical protein F4822DRAFT_225814 [Hypoxylon trugodes]